MTDDLHYFIEALKDLKFLLIIIGAVMLVVWVGVHRHDKYGCPTCTPDRYLRRHRVSQCETDRRRTQ